ncbi:hypothetical protein D1632_17540 [Chryseobacterium nematophagum]|uniref:Uncharacterized protein n=1 Tax=Chryseobacterium nematophagum TaxID=2305228 RepID=A0A3M7L7V5_9FLAO|nr:hypothetical protein [Chryseobacterium nematophagum]RMZ58095.1 hypothetical protein D1632_17540 [Chryseobacterium nematophagum]
MNKKIFLFLFLFSLIINAQIKKLSYDRILNYSIKEDNNFNIYSNDSKTDNLIIDYGESWDSSYKKHFSWQHKDHYLTGYLFNEKFLHQSGSSEYMGTLQMDFEKDANLYDIDEYKNCVAYKGVEKNKKGNNYLMVYCTVMNDNYDYSEMNKFMLANQVGIHTPPLPKNHVIVKAMMFNQNNEALFNFFDLIKMSSETQNLLFNQDYINAYINEKPFPNDKKNKPFYCKFIVEEFYLSDELEKKLNEFMSDMDTYYNEYGYTSSNDQSDFYDREIERLAKFYQKHNNLNSKQIEQFRIILKKLKTSKKEDDFFWVRDAY